MLVQNGDAAASLSVAEQYVSAFSKLAKESNTVLLPTSTGDISGMVTQVRQAPLLWNQLRNAATGRGQA